MKRYKLRLKLYDEEIPLVEQALLEYQDLNATDEKLFFKIGKLIERFYTNDMLTTQKQIKALENKGYKVELVSS